MYIYFNGVHNMLTHHLFSLCSESTEKTKPETKPVATAKVMLVFNVQIFELALMLHTDMISV